MIASLRQRDTVEAMRKLTPDGSVQSVLRMPPDFWKRADALIDHMGRRRGAPAKRADVLREALARGLRQLEKESERDP